MIQAVPLVQGENSMFCRKFYLGAILAGIAMMGLAPPAQAAFEVEVIINGGPPTIIIDEGAGDLHPGVPNDIGFFVVGPGVVVVGNGSTTNLPGTNVKALLDLQYSISAVNAPNNAGATVQIIASATGFTLPNGSPATLTSQIGGTLDPATLTAQQFQDNSNRLFVTSVLDGNVHTPGVQGPFTSSPYSSVASTTFPLVVPFSITESLITTVSAGGLVTGDFQSTVTSPAPAGLVLALTGLPCLGIGSWLRRRLRRKVA